MFGAAPKPAENAAALTSSNPNPGGLFSGNLFGKKPDPAASTANPAAPTPLGAFSLSANKDAASEGLSCRQHTPSNF
jgi:hypothetical protein